jgi:hypothetical protein
MTIRMRQNNDDSGGVFDGFDDGYKTPFPDDVAPPRRSERYDRSSAPQYESRRGNQPKQQDNRNDRRNQSHQQPHQNKQQQQGGKQQNPQYKWIFQPHEIKMMALCMLVGYLQDAGMKQEYYNRLEKMVGKNAVNAYNMLEKVIEAVETGFVLAEPQPMLTAEVLSKFVQGRKFPPDEVMKLNRIFLSRYFSLDEKPGDSLVRMLTDEGYLDPKVFLPVDIAQLVSNKVLTVAEIVKLDNIVDNAYNTTIWMHAQALLTDTKWSVFADQITFCGLQDETTEWQMKNVLVRCQTVTLKRYKGGAESVTVRIQSHDF